MKHFENNTVGLNLNSGHRSVQNVTKPINSLSNESGSKYSHGTRDASRNLKAIGGTFKESSNQHETPHSHLHIVAAEAAVKATMYYLVDADRGLLKLVGPDVFRDIFGIHSREEIVKTSLTFVIDVTGSMSDDIEKVKIATKNILHEAKDSNCVPRIYVLVTFSDQANLTTIKSTTDFQIMLTWLDEITVSGGDGCAEYAMTGILKGIEMSNNDSNIYFVTGADAKDVYLKQGVINGLKAKSLKLIAFLNDKCSRRRKRGADGQYYLSVNRGGGFQFHRVRRSSISVFEAIANATGGKVYETTTANVGEIVEKEIKDTFPSSNAFVTWFGIPATSTHDGTIFIPVDDYIKSLKIMVKNVFSLSELVCYYPNGTNVLFSLKNEKSDLSNNVLTISVKNPLPGQWKLEKKSAYSWVINVTAQSALDFTATILETSTDGNSYHLSGNPIKGNNYSVAVDIENLGTKSTCSSVALLDENGNDVTEIFVSRMYLMEIARYIGEFTPYNRSSYVQIRGTDDQGNHFLRTRPLFILPVSVQLHISPLLGDLRLHDASNITFSLTNIGEDLLDFVITITDGYSDISVQRGSLDGGKVYGGIITITPTSLQTLTLDFLVTLENYTGIIQTEKRRYFVMDSRTAHCIVTEYPKICPTEALNTGNCTFYKWNGSVQISSATIRESLIRVSTDNVILDHMNLTDSNFSVPILISGHCCIQTVVLSIIDKDGFFDQCSFTLSKQPLTIVQYHTTTEELTTLKEITSSHPATQDGHSKVIGISIGVSVLGVILMSIIVCIVRNVKVRCRQKTPVELSNYRSLERKEMETTEDLEIQSERQNLLIVDVTPGINENEDGNDSNSVNVSYCKKEEPKTAEKQKSSSKSSDYVNEETDTSSEAATTQKLQSPMKDPEKCFETKVVSESSVCPNEQTNNEDDTIVISGRRGHKEIRETGIL